MNFHVIGLNHTTAPLAIRERVALSADDVAEALQALVAMGRCEEAAVISTCNRTEVYARADQVSGILQWLEQLGRLPEGALGQYLYQYHGAAAVNHAFRVAAGLDSMVLGEPQILGQMKGAVRTAQDAGTLGALLHPLFQKTFAVAKEVRTQTDIGAYSVSMAAAAVRLARQLFGDLRNLNILFVGAGEMIDLALTHFRAETRAPVTIANRTFENADELARAHYGKAITLAELPEAVAAFDVIVSCTGATLPIIGKGLMESALKARKRRPVLMVDLGVPRDVEPEVASLNDIFLYAVDDLAAIVQEGRDKRGDAARAAQAIIDVRVLEFEQWMTARAAVPTIRHMRDFAEQFRALELERAQAALARGEDPAQVLERFSRALLNKFLHHPTTALNQADASEREQLERVITRLYPLHDKE